ncbi:MAG: right-handed parallel beta-helix repeat-containing protein [Phycisphaeraceae bacterium]|nr:right-handed parallel beta-helix repeat-containing protein [Phycisphaeraceae bacterium]
MLPRALADQHLVSPGQEWSRLAAVVQPGDEIVLLPGVHRPASLAGLRGEEGRPIVIRGADAENPGRIEVGAAGPGSGLLIQRPRHVVVQDIVVVGARHNGINIDDSDGSGSVGEPWAADVTLRRVAVLRTGPSGNTDSIKLSGLRGVRVESCIVEGWGGSAIDMVGCHDVTIEGCTFRGLPGHEQSSGVQAKGGSTRVRIVGCRFEDAGMRAVNLGGSTGLEWFRPRVPEGAGAGTRFEAQDVTVARCVFVAGDCAVAFVNSRGGVVRDCTIVGPRRWAFRLLHETADARFAPSEGGVIDGCLIVWPPDGPRTLVNVGPGARPETFRFGANAWWWPGADGAAGVRALDALPGERTAEQAVIDPRLDADYRATNAGASQFGAGR